MDIQYIGFAVLAVLSASFARDLGDLNVRNAPKGKHVMTCTCYIVKIRPSEGFEMFVVVCRNILIRKSIMRSSVRRSVL